MRVKLPLASVLPVAVGQLRHLLRLAPMPFITTPPTQRRRIPSHIDRFSSGIVLERQRDLSDRRPEPSVGLVQRFLADEGRGLLLRYLSSGWDFTEQNCLQHSDRRNVGIMPRRSLQLDNSDWLHGNRSDHRWLDIANADRDECWVAHVTGWRCLLHRLPHHQHFDDFAIRPRDEYLRSAGGLI